MSHLSHLTSSAFFVIGTLDSDTVVLRYGRTLQLRGPDGAAWFTESAERVPGILAALRQGSPSQRADAEYIGRALALFHAR